MEEQIKKVIVFCACLYLILGFCLLCGADQSRIDGVWAGTIEVMGQKLEFAVSFRTEGDKIHGSLDVLLQDIKGIALKDVICDHPKILFKLDIPECVASFEGRVEGDKITGEFEQNGIKGSFTLKRSNEQAVQEPNKPKETLPYNIEEVTFHNGDIKFTGELMCPKKEGKHPAEMNKKTMVQALEEGGNKDFEVRVFPKANHLFQEATTGSPSEYTELPREFVPGFLEFMTEWILKHVDVVK